MANDSWGPAPEASEESTTAEEIKPENAPPAATKPQLSKEEYEAQARVAGWNEKTAVNYDELNRTDDNWHGAAKVYEWNDEYGDVAPEVPELENVLFGGEFQLRKGEHFSNLQIEAFVEGPVLFSPVREFDEAGLHPVILDNIKKCGYDKPTPIQQYTIPAVLNGLDVVAIAQTGSGKTASYFIPVISKLMGKAKKLCAARPSVGSNFNINTPKVRAEPLVVVVVPTRELAMQIFDEARRMCYRSMLRPCVVYGGLPMKITIEELGKGCDILIATPGRLCDLMDKPHVLTMSRVKYTIIDEADEMLQSDWEEELRKIMAGGDTNEDADHVYMMFSATFPKAAREMARAYLSADFCRIRVGRVGQAHKNTRQAIVYVDQNAKRDALWDLLFSMTPGRTLIFCNSKATVDLIDDFLYNRGLPTTSIHSDRGQREREDALRAFRTGRCPILVATGVSSRGWDIKDVTHVINYDLPGTAYGGISEYIHRIGRTARIGHQGLATSFYNERNEDLAQDLVNVLVETDNAIPQFLSHLVPEDGRLLFDDDTDDEAEGENGNGNEGNGLGIDLGETGGVAVDLTAWGAAPTAEGAGGDGRFTADAGSHGASGAAAAAAAGW